MRCPCVAYVRVQRACALKHFQLQASVRSPLELMNFSRQVAAGIDVTVVRGYAGAGIEL